MKKKKINGKQIKFIINMICLAIFVVSYFYIYENYMNKTEATYTEAELVKAQIKDIQQKLSQEDTVKQDIADINKQKQAIIDSYPVNIEDEDNFMFIDQMEEKLNITTSAISPSESTEFYRTIIPAVGAENSSGTANNDSTKPSTMTAMVNTLSLSFITDYKGFKDMVDYIKNYPDHTSIDSVVISADTATGKLSGNLVLKRFALTGTGKVYEEPSIDGIDIGTKNIFGTNGTKNKAKSTNNTGSIITSNNSTDGNDTGSNNLGNINAGNN